MSMDYIYNGDNKIISTNGEIGEVTRSASGYTINTDGDLIPSSLDTIVKSIDSGGVDPSEKINSETRMSGTRSESMAEIYSLRASGDAHFAGIVSQSGEPVNDMDLVNKGFLSSRIASIGDIGAGGRTALFLSDGVFIVPENVTQIWITACGGGAAGGQVPAAKGNGTATVIGNIVTLPGGSVGTFPNTLQAHTHIGGVAGGPGGGDGGGGVHADNKANNHVNEVNRATEGKHGIRGYAGLGTASGGGSLGGGGMGLGNASLTDYAEQGGAFAFGGFTTGRGTDRKGDGIDTHIQSALNGYLGGGGGTGLETRCAGGGGGDAIYRLPVEVTPLQEISITIGLGGLPESSLQGRGGDGVCYIEW